MYMRMSQSVNHFHCICISITVRKHAVIVNSLARLLHLKFIRFSYPNYGHSWILLLFYVIVLWRSTHVSGSRLGKSILCQLRGSMILSQNRGRSEAFSNMIVLMALVKFVIVNEIYCGKVENQKHVFIVGICGNRHSQLCHII